MSTDVVQHPDHPKIISLDGKFMEIRQSVGVFPRKKSRTDSASVSTGLEPRVVTDDLGLKDKHEEGQGQVPGGCCQAMPRHPRRPPTSVAHCLPSLTTASLKLLPGTQFLWHEGCTMWDQQLGISVVGHQGCDPKMLYVLNESQHARSRRTEEWWASTMGKLSASCWSHQSKE